MFHPSRMAVASVLREDLSEEENFLLLVQPMPPAAEVFKGETALEAVFSKEQELTADTLSKAVTFQVTGTTGS